MGTDWIWTRSRVLIVALGLATLLYAVFLGLLYLRLPGDGYGIHLSKQGFTVDRTVAGGELQKNDTVIRIGNSLNEWNFDNKLMRPGVWYRRIFGRKLPAQATRIYTLQRGDDELPPLEVRLTRTTLGDLISRTGILFFLGLVFVLNGLFIVLRRGDDWAGRLMALALLAEGLNLINNTINLFSLNVSVSLYWLFVPLDLLSFWATFSLLLHLFLVFPKESSWFRRHPRAVWVIYAFNPLASGVGGLILGGGSALATRAAVYQLGYPIAGVQLLGALGLIIHTYRTTSRPLVRSQVRWILWGLIIGATGWLILFATPIVITGNPLADLSLAMIPLVCVPVSLTLAVTRYRLLEIDTVINRSLVYGALSIFLIAVYFIAVALISWGLQMLTGRQNDTTVVFLSTLTVALVFALVRDRFQQLIDRAFYPSKLNFQRLLHQVGRELSMTIVFDELIALLTETIPQRLAVDGAVLFVLDEAGENFVPHGPPRWDTPIPRTQELEERLKDVRVWLADHDEDESLCFCTMPGLQVCLPLFTRGRLIGLYSFGPKLSGDPYSGEELEILRTLRHQIAIAVENTRLYHQVEVYSRLLEDLVHQRTRELEQTHETIAAERNKLDAVLNTIADGLVVTDIQGRIILTNPVFEGIVGRSSANLIGLSLSEAIADINLQTIVVKALADSSQVFSSDLPLGPNVYRASACALRAEPSTPMRSDVKPNDEISGVVTVLRDVTHEVEVDRMKTDFISTVSHELRTPLTSVLGFAKLIRRTFDRNIVPALPIPASGTRAADQRKLQRAVARINENLEIIESESLRLTRLINDVLDIAKMEAGRIEWHEEEIDLAQMIHSAVAATSALAREKGLPVVVELPPSLSSPLQREGIGGGVSILFGDRDRLVQVMTNLLSNAIKFTDHGQIVVRCRVVEAEQLATLPEVPSTDKISSSPLASLRSILSSGEGHLSPPAILVSVIDSGIGIAPEDLPSVFEKFKQVGDALTDRPKGTGLGLPICKEIVEHHGGVIWAESQVGVGSTFSFALPLVISVERLPMLHEIRQRVIERLPTAREGDQKPLILVVDDEANIRRLLKQELTDAGYRVITAADGVQALAEARRYRPDLIVLDVMMPGVSGFDVTSALKADERTTDIPILILSIIEDRERGLRLGADEYLTKPIDTQRLLNTIAVLLSESSGQERKVLVIDDDVSAIESITRTLRERGFEVVEAFDPRGAILKAQREKPDLVILDAMLSQMNNYELLKALRYEDQQHRARIIVLAGEMSPQEQAETLQHGADELARRDELPQMLNGAAGPGPQQEEESD